MKDTRSDEDLDSSTRLIKQAAERRGIHYKGLLFYYDEVPHEIYELTYHNNSHLMDITSPDMTSSIANTIADNKYLTHKFLDQLSAPNAQVEVFHSIDKAMTYFRKLESACVVKPVRGGGGDGVSVNLQTMEEFVEAFELAKSFCEFVLVEQYISGVDTRFLVINGNIEAVSRRDPAYVIGDGVNSLEVLINHVNDTRQEGRKGSLSKIKIDSISLNYLAKQHMNLSTVPKTGKKIYVRPNANLNTGGISQNLSKDAVSSDTLQLIESVAKSIGLYVSGIDVICSDIRKPLRQGAGVICEINDRPRIRMHEMPHIGEAVAVSEKIIDMLFPETR